MLAVPIMSTAVSYDPFHFLFRVEIAGSTVDVVHATRDASWAVACAADAIANLIASTWTVCDKELVIAEHHVRFGKIIISHHYAKSLSNALKEYYSDAGPRLPSANGWKASFSVQILKINVFRGRYDNVYLVDYQHIHEAHNQSIHCVDPSHIPESHRADFLKALEYARRRLGIDHLISNLTPNPTNEATIQCKNAIIPSITTTSTKEAITSTKEAITSAKEAITSAKEATTSAIPLLWHSCGIKTMVYLRFAIVSKVLLIRYECDKLKYLVEYTPNYVTVHESAVVVPTTCEGALMRIPANLYEDAVQYFSMRIRHATTCGILDVGYYRGRLSLIYNGDVFSYELTVAEMALLATALASPYTQTTNIWWHEGAGLTIMIAGGWIWIPVELFSELESIMITERCFDV